MARLTESYTLAVSDVRGAILSVLKGRSFISVRASQVGAGISVHISTPGNSADIVLLPEHAREFIANIKRALQDDSEIDCPNPVWSAEGKAL